MVLYLQRYMNGNKVRPISKTTTNQRKDAPMKLLEIYHDKVIGAIKGLDRIRFRGTLRGLSDSIGINMFMSATGLLLKDLPLHQNSWVKVGSGSSPS